MMYQDKFGLYHLRPCVDGEPSGNDGPIITAYAQKEGLEVDLNRIKELYWDQLAGGEIPTERLPGKSTPPPSRDTVLGWYWLGFLSVPTLIKHDWSFSPFPLPKFNIYKTILALWRMRKAHRNTLWQGSGEPHLWRFAFSVPIQDRAYMLRHSGYKVPWSYTVFEFIHKKLIWKSESSKRIAWRKI